MNSVLWSYISDAWMNALLEDTVARFFSNCHCMGYMQIVDKNAALR